jgi:hypothetical protein
MLFYLLFSFWLIVIVDFFVVFSLLIIYAVVFANFKKSCGGLSENGEKIVDSCKAYWMQLSTSLLLFARG